MLQPSSVLVKPLPRTITIEIGMLITSVRKNPRKVPGILIAVLSITRQTGSKSFAHLYVFDASFPKRQARFVKAA